MFYRITDKDRVPLHERCGAELMADTPGEAWALLGARQGRVFHATTGAEVFPLHLTGRRQARRAGCAPG